MSTKLGSSCLVYVADPRGILPGCGSAYSVTFEQTTKKWYVQAKVAAAVSRGTIMTFRDYMADDDDGGKKRANTFFRCVRRTLGSGSNSGSTPGPQLSR